MTDFYSHHSSSDLSHSTTFKIHFKLKYANLFKYHREIYHVPCWLNWVLYDYHCSPNYPMFLCVCLVAQLCLTLCDPIGCSPTRILYLRTFPGKDSGEGCPLLLQGIFLTQEICVSRVSCIGGGIFTTAPPGKPNPTYYCSIFIFALFPILLSFFFLISFSLLFCHSSFPLFFF